MIERCKKLKKNMNFSSNRHGFLFKAFTIICLFIFSTAFAESGDSLKKIKVGVLPSLFYSPETRLGFGGLFYTYFKPSKNDTLTRKSNTQSYISYTLNKQFSVENDYRIWLKNNKYYLTGAFDYSRFPQLYYGIGNDTKEDEKIMVSFDIIRVQTKNFIQFSNNMYGGMFFQYQNIYNQDVKLTTGSARTDIYGSEGFEAKGIGPIFIIDKRDNQLNPAKGGYLEVSYMDYKNIIPNKNKFISLVIDARKYATFFNRLIWNANAYFAYNKGQVPYRLLPEIGGAHFLRGYYRGRFRDNNMAILQHEFRMPVYKMFGLAVFSGIGSVAQNVSLFKTNEIHYNYGVGLRVRIDKKENTNIRIDYGFTKDSQGLYIVFAEAF